MDPAQDQQQDDSSVQADDKPLTPPMPKMVDEKAKEPYSDKKPASGDVAMAQKKAEALIKGEPVPEDAEIKAEQAPEAPSVAKSGGLAAAKAVMKKEEPDDSPPPPPAIGDANDEAEADLDKDKKMSTTGKILMVAGPLFLVASLSVSALMFNVRSGAPVDNTKSEQTADELQQMIQRTTVTLPNGITIAEETKLKWDRWLNSVPVNPAEVKVMCESTGAQISSGVATVCSDPVFMWSEGKAQEKGTRVIGYQVYFGKENNTTPFPEPGSKQAVSPKKMGWFQEGREFKPDELERGATYYLFVQTVSDSANEDYKYGQDIVSREKYSTRPADILFEYVYE